MSNVRRVLTLLIAVVVVAATGIAAFFGFTPAVSVLTHTPELDCVSQIDIDEAYAGDSVSRTIAIGNTGGAPLTVHSLQTSCSCLLLSWSSENRVIPPGSSLEATVSITVFPQVGTSQSAVVGLVSDDPKRPEHRVVLTVRSIRSSVVVTPSAIPFDELNLGETKCIRSAIEADQSDKPVVLDVSSDSGIVETVSIPVIISAHGK